jgi:SsrA-binding protein
MEVVNRRAAHDYSIGEKFSAGLVLKGTEVKSCRGGYAQISEAFVRIEKGKYPILYHAHIDEYSHGTDANHEPLRPRSLLLHRKEIHRLRMAVEREGMAIVPLRLYWAHGLVKIDIAICKGKHLYDKRQDLKKAAEIRESARSWRHRNR